MRTIFTAQPYQTEFLKSKARFRCISAGRRSGKTLSASIAIIQEIAESKRPLTIWWVAPQYEQAVKIGMRVLLQYLPREWITKTNISSPPTITLKNGTEITFHSAEPPADRLRGYSVDFLVLDEASMIKADVWNDILRPTLADRQGKMLAISTPKGHNWFFELWVQGQGDNPNVKSWQFPTSINRFISKEEIEVARVSIPELSFRQEWCAEFLEDIGAVFRNIKACIKGTYEEPSAGRYYKMGVDLAKYSDFTVLTVMDDQHHVVAFDRFNQINWVFQKQRIYSLAKKYNANLCLDSTGVGDPIYDDLVRAGLTVEPFKFTNESKANLIENLSINIEQMKLSYPPIDVLLNELKIFGFEKTDAGRITYNAPEGFNDDCVISLALAIWAYTSKTAFIFASLDKPLQNIPQKNIRF